MYTSSSHCPRTIIESGQSSSSQLYRTLSIKRQVTGTSQNGHSKALNWHIEKTMTQLDVLGVKTNFSRAQACLSDLTNGITESYTRSCNQTLMSTILPCLKKKTDLHVRRGSNVAFHKCWIWWNWARTILLLLQLLDCLSELSNVISNGAEIQTPRSIPNIVYKCIFSSSRLYNQKN